MRHNGRMLRFHLPFARCVAALSFALGAVSPTWAWNACGHRVIATLAWEWMSPPARAEAALLLSHHPDNARWLSRAGASDDEVAATAFTEASTWADDIRDDPRYLEDTEATPDSDFDWARHRQWHYVDDAESTRAGELDLQLERLSARLSNTANPAPVRSHALVWLIHLVGDAHQPLHVGRHADQGGNKFSIEEPDHPRYPGGNLHRWWDDLPCAPWLRGERLQPHIERLEPTARQTPQASPEIWLAESRDLVRSAVYPESALITPDFRARAQVIADRRLAAAGERLGRWLNTLLVGVSRETASK